MSKKNYRKIIVGDDFSSSMAFVKNVWYLKRTVIITDIITSEKPGYIDIYVAPNKTDASVLWKRVREDKVLEEEFDVNFE